MNNLLINIIDTILDNKWCFNYNGACGTCGMMDVKNELKKYNINDIVYSFKELDFEDEEVQKHIVELEKIYSLMTGPYTVWHDKNKIKELRRFWESKEKGNSYIENIQASDYDTYWTKWEADRNLYAAQEDKRQALAKERKEYIVQLKENDKEDRENGMRDVLIDELKDISTFEKLILMSKDTRHTPKYYPGNIANSTIPEYIDMLSDEQYQGLCRLFDMHVKGPSPWAKFKAKFLNGR